MPHKRTCQSVSVACLHPFHPMRSIEFAHIVLSLPFVMVSRGLCSLLHCRELSSDRSVGVGLEQWAEECVARVPQGRRTATPDTSRSTMAVAYAHDGTFLAASHGDHRIRILHVESGRCVRELEGHPRTCWTLGFHPTRRDLLASACIGGTVRVWNWRMGECLHVHPQFEFPISCVSFHFRLDILAITAGTHIFFWFYSRDQHAIDVMELSDTARFVSFHPYEEILVIAHNSSMPFRRRPSRRPLFPVHPVSSRRAESLVTLMERMVDEGNSDEEENGNEDADRRFGLFTYPRPPSQVDVHVYGLSWGNDEQIGHTELFSIPNVVFNSSECMSLSLCGRYMALCARMDAEDTPRPQPSPFSMLIVSLPRGKVLRRSDGILHPHLVTSIQFSPRARIFLLGKGKEDIPLQDATIVTFYKVKDMQPYWMLKDASGGPYDANCAVFHPYSGGGFCVGTRTGEVWIY